MARKVGFNQVILKGGIVKDPELKYTKDNVAFLRFNLACPCQVQKNGQREEVVDYVPCMAWGNRAEVIGKYCVKGTQIFIAGKVKTDKYDGKDGQTVWTPYVLVQDIQFAGGKRKDNAQPEPAGPSNVNPDMGVDFGAEDIPF